MLRKIVSGGQTGVDRAALDAALANNFPCGGWCPLGRLSEDGPIEKQYPLRETPTSVYAERTEWNVRDSDVTLILTWGAATGGTLYTMEMAEKHSKPCFQVDFSECNEVEEVIKWIEKNGVEVLNVAGPRASTLDKSIDIYKLAEDFLSRLLRNSQDSKQF